MYVPPFAVVASIVPAVEESHHLIIAPEELVVEVKVELPPQVTVDGDAVIVGAIGGVGETIFTV